MASEGARLDSQEQRVNGVARMGSWDNSQGLEGWLQQISLEIHGTPNLTLGIASGDRELLDRRVLDLLARKLVQPQTFDSRAEKLLVVRVRFDLVGARTSLAMGEKRQSLPSPQPSPLGGWCYVDLIPSHRRQDTELTQQISRGLPGWKQKFRLILIELGSLGSPLSRSLGFLCDGSYIVLGPDSCGSPLWLRQNIDLHLCSGSQISGLITAGFHSPGPHSRAESRAA